MYEQMIDEEHLSDDENKEIKRISSHKEEAKREVNDTEIDKPSQYNRDDDAVQENQPDFG